MTFTDLIGLLAGIGTSVSLVPQAVKIWKTRTARDVSGIMFLVFATGVSLWLWYGFLISAWPVIVTNAFALVLALSILTMKVLFDRKETRQRSKLT